MEQKDQKRILRYVLGTLDFGVKFVRDARFSLTKFIDSD
jgi:hypothetical protein